MEVRYGSTIISVDKHMTDGKKAMVGCLVTVIDKAIDSTKFELALMSAVAYALREVHDDRPE